jgi:hypothetical protein
MYSARSLARASSSDGPWKILPTNAEPSRPTRAAIVTAEQNSSKERNWSVARSPMVDGAMSDTTRSNGPAATKASISSSLEPRRKRALAGSVVRSSCRSTASTEPCGPTARAR